MKFKIRTLAVLLSLLPALSGANVRYVGPSEAYSSIKWAYNESLEGDTIIVRDGTYAENLIIEKSITFLSENLHGAVIGTGDGSKGFIRIRNGSVTVDGFMFNPNNASNGIVVGEMDPANRASDCIIRNNKILNRTTGILISPFAQNTSLESNIIAGSYQSGIEMSGSGTNTFTGNHISNSIEHGIVIHETMDGSLTILNDTVTGNGKTGVTIEGNMVTLRGCLIAENGEDGIWTNSGRQDILISDGSSISQNLGSGIYIESGTSMVVENSEVNDNLAHGILIRVAGSAAISGSTFQGNQFNGIMCSGSVTLSGSTLSGNVPCGIELFGSGDMENNTISENADLGIFVHEGCTRVVIKNNMISLQGGSGIMMASAGEVSGNTIDRNRTGIQLEGSDGTVTISGGNIIRNQIEHGIVIAHSANAMIEGNTISGNGTGVTGMEDYSGVLVSGSATIRDNHINENGASGILIGPEAGEVIVRDNPEINGNREGIWMNSRARLENNTIENNINQGILTAEGADSSIIKNNVLDGNRTGMVIRENVSDIFVFGCEIVSNERGVVSSGGALFERNTIQYNTAYGVRIVRSGIRLGERDGITGGYNTILNNSPWNIVNLTADTVFACYNYWGTQDSIEIDSTISDNDEDSLAGPVIFIPMATEDPTGVEPFQDQRNQGEGTILRSIYPNPFHEELHIRFSLNVASPVWIRLFGMDGRLVGVLVNGTEFPSGDHTVIWSGIRPVRQGISEGLYLLEIHCGQERFTRKVQLAR
jgi:parallel beta-helix repeat protein